MQAEESKPSILLKRSRDIKDWSVIIKDWRNSGLSQREFCVARGIYFNSFIHQYAKHAKKKETVQFSLVTADATPSKASMPQQRVELCLQSGIVIRLSNYREQLPEVLQILGDASC